VWGSCEHDNEFLVSVKDKKLQQLSKCQLLKKKQVTDKYFIFPDKLKKEQLNSVVLVRKRTIPTERPQPIGEVSANFS
jgi:hypothetical protein